MLSKLRRQLTLDMTALFLIILVGAVALLSLSSYTYAKNMASDTMQDILGKITPETVSITETDDGRKAKIDREALGLTNNISVLILSEDGSVLCLESYDKTMRAFVEDNLSDILRAVTEKGKEDGVITAQSLRYYEEPLEGVGTKVALMDRTDELDSIYFQLRMYVVLAVIILVFVLLLSDFLARRSILPVDEAIRSQQQFIADASHELKTPLTVILANLDIISSSPDATVKESEKWINNTKSEARRMSKLVNEMLFLARSDAAMDMKYDFRLIDFSTVVDEVVLTTEALAFERNITLESDIAETAPVVGDFERLKQLVMILVENATKYVDENGTISVKLESTGRRTEVLTIRNTGTPIPPEKSEHIFDRFFRADDSRTRDKGGYGLGLSIAQKIVERHNGEIALDFSNENGTQFSVRLPNAQSLKAPDLSLNPEEA